MEKSNQKDLRRGGLYWKKDPKLPYLSVTQSLSIIDKPQLRRWFGKMVYWAMVEDPTMKEEEALSAPYKKSSEAAGRGTTVHSIIEVYKHTKEHVEGVPEAFRGYANAFRSWIDDYDIEILENERTVFSEKYSYAGTLDIIAKNKKSGKTLIVDVKTGKDIYPEAFLQLSAYKQALAEEGIAINSTAVLLLKEDGSYNFEEEDGNFQAFLATMILFRWKNPDIDSLIKIYRKAGKNGT